MNLVNFKIADSIAIESGAQYFDLHSNYDFRGFAFNTKDNSLTLEWTKCTGAWAEKENVNFLKMMFDKVSVFAVKSRDIDIPSSENETLAYVGFLHPDDTELMEGFLPPEYNSGEHHLVFGFESELVIKVFSKSVVLHLD